MKERRTYLPPQEEARFRRAYARDARRWGIDANPDDPRHNYDFRGAFASGFGPDAVGHWPSLFKDADHADRYLVDESGLARDTATGRNVPAVFLHLNAARGERLRRLLAQLLAEDPT